MVTYTFLVKFQEDLISIFYVVRWVLLDFGGGLHSPHDFLLVPGSEWLVQMCQNK